MSYMFRAAVPQLDEFLRRQGLRSRLYTKLDDALSTLKQAGIPEPVTADGNEDGEILVYTSPSEIENDPGDGSTAIALLYRAKWVL